MRAVVTAAVCPLTTGPGDCCELADEALFGMVLEVLSPTKRGFLRVRTPYRYEGFAPVSCLTLDPAAVHRWTALPKSVAAQGYCTVLTEPRFQAPVRIGLPRGAVVAPCGEGTADGWQRICLPNGEDGYTRSIFLSEYYKKPPPISESELRERVISSALGYLGTHYRWGGKTVLGIDCSGLTSMAYLLNGIRIFRDARIEPGFPVREIPPRDIRPADLLYFPGHTALYLGDGRILHATGRAGSDGVVLSSLTPDGADYRPDLADSITAAGTVFPLPSCDKENSSCCSE